MLILSNLDLVFDVIDFTFGVSVDFHIPNIVFSDLGIHPAEHLIRQFVLEIGSDFYQRFEAPADRSWEIVASSDGIDAENDPVGVNPSTDDLIYDPEDCTVSPWDDDSDVGLVLVLSEYFNLLNELCFLGLVEEVGHVDEGIPVGLVLELHLAEIVSEVLTSFAIAAFGVDEKEKMEVGWLSVTWWFLRHLLCYNCFCLIYLFTDYIEQMRVL